MCSYETECIDLTNIDDTDDEQEHFIGPISLIHPRRPISLLHNTTNRGRKRTNADDHNYNATQTKRARIVIDSLSDSEDIDIDLTENYESETSVSSDETVIENEDDIISNHIFKGYITIIDNDKVFGKKRRGKRRHKVEISTDPILPAQNVNIRRNNKGEFYCNNIPITQYVLAQNDWMKVEIELIMDSKICGASKQFKIPKQQRIEWTENNSIFCCCGSIYEKEIEYGIKKRPKNTKKRKNTKKKKTNGKRKPNTNTNSNTNTNTKQVNLVKIDILKVMVKDQKLHIIWTVDGIEDINKFVVDDDDIKKEDDEDEVGWIKCNGPCEGTWQHTKCINPKYRKMNDNGTYQCWLCSKTHDVSINILTSIRRMSLALQMIESMYSYNRNKRIVQYGGNRNVYNKWSKQEIIKIALKLGINIDDNTDNIDKDGLINKIIKAPIFTQTPPKLCEYIASIESSQGDIHRIAELGAGHGNITCCIREVYPNAVIDAFEINGDRVSAAKKMYNELNINWIKRDIFSIKHLEEIDDGMEKYDRIIFNPSFEYAFGFIYIAFQMIKPDGCLIVLLPDNFFQTADRIRLSKILSFKIIERHCVGTWDYYPSFDRNCNIKPKTRCKPTADSIYILQKFDIEKDDLDKKFSYQTVDTLLHGHL